MDTGRRKYHIFPYEYRHIGQHPAASFLRREGSHLQHLLTSALGICIPWLVASRPWGRPWTQGAQGVISHKEIARCCLQRMLHFSRFLRMNSSARCVLLSVLICWKDLTEAGNSSKLYIYFLCILKTGETKTEPAVSGKNLVVASPRGGRQMEQEKTKAPTRQPALTLYSINCPLWG